MTIDGGGDGCGRAWGASRSVDDAPGHAGAVSPARFGGGVRFSRNRWRWVPRGGGMPRCSHRRVPKRTVAPVVLTVPAGRRGVEGKAP
jgi:hypothetical protein